jgi:hypothetical protein
VGILHFLFLSSSDLDVIFNPKE